MSDIASAAQFAISAGHVLKPFVLNEAIYRLIKDEPGVIDAERKGLIHVVRANSLR